MRRFLRHFLTIFLSLLLVFSAVPTGFAQETDLSLSGYIRSSERRHYVEAMLNYYIRDNETIRQTLEDGYSAVFFFEGCSDNMDDPALSDLSYYRVSAVCVVVKLDEAGQPEIRYVNTDSSTLPDRPLEFGAWELETAGEVGPATVCDGTYELYSVYHGGSYEALQMRTSYADETVSAIYMLPGGYVHHPANAINIHTRTGNHVIQKAMWSAGCMLVGAGDWLDYVNLIVSTYYSKYENFRVDRYVGCVTINRQNLRQELFELYENMEAVDALLEPSREEHPSAYLEKCDQNPTFREKLVQTTKPVKLMNLPCSSSTDSRSIPVTALQRGDKIDICGSIVNTQEELWYEVSFIGENCYVPAEAVEEVSQSWMDRIGGYFKS